MTGLHKLIFACSLSFLLACSQPHDNRVHITYWEKWSGAEASAMQQTVDQFNQSQDRIVVEFLSTSNVDRKTLVATAGGDPPDVAGLFQANIYSFADRSALTPLDDFILSEGGSLDEWQARYAPVYADMCQYRGKIWAVPSTPSVVALHWNKQAFREAGLDPEQPPRTLAELDAFAERLTKRDPATGEIKQLGFLPQEPGWFSWAFPAWFGGRYLSNEEICIGTETANHAAYQWARGYSERYGHTQIRRFTEGFGRFSSPQNPFFSGKICMEFQGVWMNNFISQFAPGLEYGVAAWPTVEPRLEGFVVAESDVLAIPRGSKHPREAWEFIKFISSMNSNAQSRDELRGIELLCYLQQKNSPLREWSPYFTQHHPHPYIGLFRQMADNPNATHLPKMGIWQEYRREVDNIFETVLMLVKSPDEALQFAQARLADSWRWHRKSLKLQLRRNGSQATGIPHPDPLPQAGEGNRTPASPVPSTGEAGPSSFTGRVRGPVSDTPSRVRGPVSNTPSPSPS